MTSILAQGELKIEFVSPLVVYGNELYCSCPAFRSAEFWSPGLLTFADLTGSLKILLIVQQMAKRLLELCLIPRQIFIEPGISSIAEINSRRQIISKVLAYGCEPNSLVLWKSSLLSSLLSHFPSPVPICIHLALFLALVLMGLGWFSCGLIYPLQLKRRITAFRLTGFSEPVRWVSSDKLW